ncbi:tetratricopeptide repeat protein [Ulvibacter litoralis]|uniref:Tetratricopeptide repeat-containing protein n=1 Tax=Ulvibacter litoralis TaxID=227084 RepID=A0A1G7GTX0_9FLAO|nr:tetratricopeptide repeat protein [Ulvibacter litoralis]GHC60108.1 hypothetical protein GCM10008083_26430 [Ulvibacter litoralis]SDE91565.1 hypothetical protein SAMN05421855_103327 [Ulvibacter litoralis]
MTIANYISSVSLVSFLKQVSFCTLFFLINQNISAQTKLDSLINVAHLKVYEDPMSAIKMGEQIFNEASIAKTKINALMLISNGYLSKREYEKSLEYSLKTREFFDEIDDPKVKISVLNNIGMQHQQLLIYDKAIENLDEALKWAEKVTHKDSIASILGTNYAIRGFIYREQMSCDIALNYFNKSISEFKKALKVKKTMNANLSILNYNKGNCELQVSQIDSARVNFNKSIKYAKVINANSLYAFAKKGLSEVYTIEGNYNQAINELNEALKVSDSVGDLVLDQGIYKNLSDNYLAINNQAQYQLYFGKYSKTQKQIRKKERSTINSSITSLLEETKLQINQKKKELQKLQIVLLILIVFSLLFLSNRIIKSRKNYKKALKNLEKFKK